MLIINIIFYIAVLILLSCILYFIIKRKPIVKYDVSEVDVNLTDLNKFIKRETLFQVIMWFTSKSNVKNMSTFEHASVIVSDLKNTDEIKKKVSVITSLIVGNLSPLLIEQFKQVYNINAYSSLVDALSIYVSRMVLFYFRKINTDITVLVETNSNRSVDSIIKMYTLSIENEIYKDNNIETTTSDDVENNENKGAIE
jgi:hypothetical protein